MNSGNFLDISFSFIFRSARPTVRLGKAQSKHFLFNSRCRQVLSLWFWMREIKKKEILFHKSDIQKKNETTMSDDDDFFSIWIEWEEKRESFICLENMVVIEREWSDDYNSCK